MAIKSRHLRLHLWQEIIYFSLVAIAPAVVTSIEVFSSHNSVFKITFSSVGCLLLLVMILKKFVFHNWIDKLREKCILLEHDYSINNGDQNLCKRQWAICNMIQYAYSVIVLLLSVFLLYFLLTAVSEGVIAFRGASLLILLFVLAAIIFRLACYLTMYRSTLKDSNEK